MLKKRLIPQLLIDKKKLLKTHKFSNPRYLGDPLNAVSIFNDKKADEIFIIDINNETDNQLPDFDFINKLASQCFMPFGYGGKINTLDIAKKIFDLGIEKIVLQSAAFTNPKLISEIASIYGSQSIVISIDLKKNFFGKLFIKSKKIKIRNNFDIKNYISDFINLGAGEILINNIDLEGTLKGLDVTILSMFKKYCTVPLLINGGLKNLEDANKAYEAGADGVVGGSFFVFYGKHNGVLISYPTERELYG